MTDKKHRLEDEFNALIRGIGGEVGEDGRAPSDVGANGQGEAIEDDDDSRKKSPHKNANAFKEWKARQMAAREPPKLETKSRDSLEEVKAEVRRGATTTTSEATTRGPSLRFYEAEDDVKHLKKWEKDVNKMFSMVDMTTTVFETTSANSEGNDLSRDSDDPTEESPDDVPSTDEEEEEDFSTDNGEGEDEEEEDAYDLKERPTQTSRRGPRIDINDEMLHRVLSSRPPVIPNRSVVREAVANDDLRRPPPPAHIARDSLRDTWRATYVILAIAAVLLAYILYLPITE